MVMRDRATIRPLMDPTASVADYSNRPDSLGYAFFWRANRLFPGGEIRFLTIDGIAPTPENIRSGRYPLTFPLVMATRQSPRKEVRELMAWICSPEGQELIDRAGFVSLKGRIRDSSVTTLKKEKREAAAQRRPARSERKNSIFPRNDRLYGLKRTAFQTENALKRIFAAGEKPRQTRVPSRKDRGWRNLAEQKQYPAPSDRSGPPSGEPLLKCL